MDASKFRTVTGNKSITDELARKIWLANSLRDLADGIENSTIKVMDIQTCDHVTAGQPRQGTLFMRMCEP